MRRKRAERSNRIGVRGRGKVSAGGHVEVPGFGQLEVPILRALCRRGVRAPDGDRDGVSQSQSPPGGAFSA
jgi:hypothetical protein